jgi:hypothetical protein
VTLSYNPQSTAAVDVLKNQFFSPSLTALIGRRA